MSYVKPFSLQDWWDFLWPGLLFLSIAFIIWYECGCNCETIADQTRLPIDNIIESK